MELSQAMRLGAMNRRQNFGALINRPRTATCALGAACDAHGLLSVIALADSYWPMADYWPVLNKIVPHPVEPDTSIAVMDLIIDLNDRLKWTRERIADWVESIEQQQAAPATHEEAMVP